MPPKDAHAVLDTVAQLETSRHSTTPLGQRQFRRCVVRGDAELLPEDRQVDRQPVQVSIRDLSWGGMGFICDHDLPVNSRWRVHFLIHGHVVGQLSMLVRHSCRVDDGVHLMGGQFIAHAGLLHIMGVTEDQLSTTGDSPTHDTSFIPPAEVA